MQEVQRCVVISELDNWNAGLYDLDKGKIVLHNNYITNIVYYNLKSMKPQLSLSLTSSATYLKQW